MAKRMILILGLSLLAMAVVGCTGIVGNGQITEEVRTLDRFDRIVVTGAGDVFVEFGESESVRIEAESNLMEYLETTVRGDTLEIGTRDNVGITTTRGYDFYVTVTELEGLEITGAADVTLPEIVMDDDFEIRISGAGDITVASLEAESLDVEITGAGSVRVEGGSVESQEVTLSGAGDYNGRELMSVDAEVQISGAGGVTVNVTGELSGNISGAGSLRYAGEPEEVDVDTSGVGSVSALN